MEATGEAPSARLLDGSFDECARWDFDQAILMFGRWVTAMLAITKPRRVQALPTPRKGQAWAHLPVHTLTELLGLTDDDPAARADGAIVTDPDAAPIDFSAWEGLDDDDDSADG